MEKQFCINWQFIVEEAKQRRKEQKLTQEKLAKLCGLSTPTVLRFEGGQENIEMSSVLSILQMLGMRDVREIDFANSSQYHDFDKDEVIFFGFDREQKIMCMISDEALKDHFDPRKDPLKNFIANRTAIERKARQKYISNLTERDGSILIRTEDF